MNRIMVLQNMICCYELLCYELPVDLYDNNIGKIIRTSTNNFPYVLGRLFHSLPFFPFRFHFHWFTLTDVDTSMVHLFVTVTAFVKNDCYCYKTGGCRM